MSCCGRQRLRLPSTRVRAAVPTKEMLYSAHTTSLTGLDSKRYNLAGPLIRAPGRPANGWRATLPIKGQNVEVHGRTPVETYNHAVTLLGRNGLRVPAHDIWLNLNMVWMARTPEKYHIVRMGDLLKISRVVEAAPADPRKRSYKPSDYGRFLWGWLNLFLAREEYHFRDFLTQCVYVLDVVNPDTNPEIGCAECFREFGKAVQKLKEQPQTNREGARKWLVDVHNEVNQRIGKKVLTYAEASKAAYWT